MKVNTWTNTERKRARRIYYEALKKECNLIIERTRYLAARSVGNSQFPYQLFGGNKQKV